MNFYGYKRPDGRVGVRNKVLILPASVCASDTTRIIAQQLMDAVGFILIFQAANSILTKGVLRGGGDTRYGMILDLISIWGIVLPVSYLAAFCWNWPPVAVVICLNADQVFKCVPAAIRVNRFRWINNLTRKDGAAAQKTC